MYPPTLYLDSNFESLVLEIMYQILPSILCYKSILMKDNLTIPIISKYFEHVLEEIAPGFAQHFHINP